MASASPSETRSFVDWMRARQQWQRRHEPVIALRQRTGDGSEAADVHAQEQAWAQRHAQERRLHDSALAQLRHG